MTRIGKERPQETARQNLAKTIRRQVRSQTTRGLLRSLPTFEVVSDVPEQLQTLMCRLEAAEAQCEEGPNR